VSYGDWAQWKRRTKQARRKGKGAIGVLCKQCEVSAYACPACALAHVEWRERNGLGATTKRLSLQEAGRELAGL
jgi:hypothetical protein